MSVLGIRDADEDREEMAGLGIRHTPGGLLTGELRALLAPLAASPRCAGVNVTIHDPNRDPSGDGAALLAGLLEDVFAQP
ncbi:hypothetical protein [Streptomyces lydicus]|uniref:hypothetical protein n=1 Tax=Streptomyces lydicus TaxID=47763 RepID=UPI00379CDD6D